MEEKFCLKWNEFQENTIKTFSNLRQEDAFCDVTLVSDDQRQMMAHQVILSSCSEYFKNILKSNKHSHPMICLIGITSTDLENVLDYIYHGEVQVFQKDIDNFLNIAQRLKLGALLSFDDEKDNKKYEKNCNKPLVPDENEQTHVFKKESSSTASAISIPSYGRLSVGEIEQMVMEYLGKNENGDFICKLCGKVGEKHGRHMKNHIETHLEGISVSCEICGKQFRSRNSLNIHKTRYHKNRKYFYNFKLN